jgi:histidinol-phosphate aminotransferase
MSDPLARVLAQRVPAPFSELAPYVPDLAHVPVRLDANEAPALLPTLRPEERALWDEALARVEPARYPDARARALRAAIAEQLHVGEHELTIGCGSDEVIQILLATLAREVDGRAPVVLVPAPTFVMYRVSGRVHGHQIVEVPLDAAWDLDLDAMVSAMRAHRPAVIFLATPNNPTASAFARDRVEAIIDEAARLDPPAIVVVDEAYLPFRLGADDPWGGVTGLDLRARGPHVLVLRTLSKIGLAALRVGWAVGDARLIAELEKARLPYDLPSYSQAGAVVALGPLAPAIERHVAAVVAERARLRAALSSIPGLELGRADGNFFWIGLDRPAAPVAQSLKARGVLVRSFGPFPRRLRVSVGTSTENARFLEAFAEALAEGPVEVRP